MRCLSGQAAAPIAFNPSPLSEVEERALQVCHSLWMPSGKRGCRSRYREKCEQWSRPPEPERPVIPGLALDQPFRRTMTRLSRTMIKIQDGSHGVSFAVKVHPRAKKNVITGELGDALKISLTTAPVEGRANEACIEFFARLLKVPRSSVTIASGQTSRNKVIRVSGVTVQYVRDRLGR